MQNIKEYFESYLEHNAPDKSVDQFVSLLNGVKFERRKIAVEDIYVDFDYQRKISPQHFRMLLAKFNPQIMDDIFVVRDDNGHYHVIDGHHRVGCAVVKGYRRIWARVYTDLPHHVRAAIFLELDNGKRKLDQYTKFHAEVTAQDPEACAILHILRKRGFDVPHTANANGRHVLFVNLLRRLWKHDQTGSMLTTVASLVQECWPDGENKYRTNHLVWKGLFDLLRSPQWKAKGSLEWLIKKLSDVLPQDIVKVAKSNRFNEQKLPEAKAVAEVYNKGKKTTNRLRLPK